MRICLFEWNNGGHNSAYVQAFVEVLAPRADVVVVACAPIATAVRERFGIEVRSLGEPRPRPAKAPGMDKATLALQEIELMRDAVAETNPDHLLLPYADPILRWLAKTPQWPCKVTALSMFSSAHVPSAYGLKLTSRERASALFKEWNIRRWRRRPDANAIYGLDPAAISLWQRMDGAPPIWLPEPPLILSPAPKPPEERAGCFLFGALDQRKGLKEIANALSHGCEGFELAIYGTLAADFAGEFAEAVELLESTGIALELRLDASYGEAMEKMACSRCALLSFAWKPPAASRVLLEASTARTPVITGAESAVARIVERNGLGLTADPRDPRALRQAFLSLTEDPSAPARYELALQRYAERMSRERFATQTMKAFELS